MAMADHPDYGTIEARLISLTDSPASLSKHLFRMVKPDNSTDDKIINGGGGIKATGRWNIRGRYACTYASYTPETALQEALSRVREDHLPDERALPKTLVTIGLMVAHALDLTDGRIRQRLGVSRERMIEKKQWRTDNYYNRESITQAIGRAAVAAEFEALIVPSAADAPNGVNVVIFPDNLRSGSTLIVVTPINQ